MQVALSKEPKVKYPKLKHGRWAKVRPPRTKVRQVVRGRVFELYVEGVLVGTATAHPSGLGWKVVPEHGRNRVMPTISEALDLLRKLDQEWQWKSIH